MEVGPSRTAFELGTFAYLFLPLVIGGGLISVLFPRSASAASAGLVRSFALS